MSATSEQVSSERSSSDAPPERMVDTANSEGVTPPTAIRLVTEEAITVQTEPPIVPVSIPQNTPSGQENKHPSLDQISTAAESVNDSPLALPTSPKAENSTHDGESIDHPAPAQPVVNPIPEQPVVETEAVQVNPTVGQPVVKAARRLKFPSIDESFDWFIAFGAGLWLLFTILYAWDVSTSNRIRPLFSSLQNPAKATLDLRILSEGVTYGLSILLAYSTAVVQWAAASTTRGVTFSTWLAMSPATDYWGLFHLLRWKCSKTGLDLHYQWIFVR